ncbi:MAG: thioredoxin fold domain-containing protein, partial [Candidatus Zixiibacteriota bacterium]
EDPQKPAVDSGTIVWRDYDEGMTLARQNGKHIMVNFATKWCGYCKKMNKTTFTEREIIGYLNEYFITIKVDGDSKRELNIDGYKISERNLTRAEYRVTGYPTYWFLKSDGEKIGPAQGYKSKDQLLDILSYVKDDLYDSMSFGDYVKKGGHKSREK